jgi:hypothetical protein
MGHVRVTEHDAPSFLHTMENTLWWWRHGHVTVTEHDAPWFLHKMENTLWWWRHGPRHSN